MGAIVFAAWIANKIDYMKWRLLVLGRWFLYELLSFVLVFLKTLSGFNPQFYDCLEWIKTCPVAIGICYFLCLAIPDNIAFKIYKGIIISGFLSTIFVLFFYFKNKIRNIKIIFLKDPQLIFKTTKWFSKTMIMVNYLLVSSIFTEKIQHIYLSVSETIMFGPWEVKIIS